MTESETDTDPDEASHVPSRDELMARLANVFAEAARKVDEGRVYDAENERVRQNWLRTAAYVADKLRLLMKDADEARLEEFADRIDALERMYAPGPPTADVREAAADREDPYR